jgi:hypothetical protein
MPTVVVVITVPLDIVNPAIVITLHPPIPQRPQLSIRSAYTQTASS